MSASSPSRTSRLTHYRGRWPEPAVPDGQPEWMLFEVDAGEDVVLRTIDVFPDGSMQRNSLALEERDGYPCISIVHGPFMQTVREAALEQVAFELFEGLWDRATDVAYP